MRTCSSSMITAMMRMGELLTITQSLSDEAIVVLAEEFGRQKRGARILLKEVADPRHYGCPEIRGRRITRIEEKPRNPRSRYAVLGIYMYDSSVFSIVRNLKPSKRGELEITDVNNAYVRKGLMQYDVLEGWWGDAGESIEAYLRVNKMVAEYGANKIT